MKDIGTFTNITLEHIFDKTRNLEGYKTQDTTGRNLYFYKQNVGEVLKEFFKNHSGNLEESNWSRVITHIENGCCFISASRGENTEQENAESTDRLAADIRSLGLGYIQVLGGFIENKGTPDEVEVTERSFIIPQPNTLSDVEFFESMIDLCKKYNQDSVLISMPGYCDFGYYNKDGELDFSPGEKLVFSEDKIGEYFSTLHKGSKRNKKFAFTEWLAVRRAGSISDRVLMHKNKEDLHLIGAE